MRKQQFAKGLAAAFSILTILSLASGNALAASVTTAANASVSSDSLNGSSVALPALVLTESTAGDIPAGTLTLTLPAKFVFDTTSVANVVYTGSGLAGGSTVSFPDNSHVSVSVTATSTAAGTLTIGSVTPLKVKVTQGTPLASGNITLSSGSVTGISTSTVFGTLTQVPGAANKLVFTIQPTGTVNSGVSFNSTVAVQDQFGNTVSSDNGRTINLSLVAISPTTTTGTLSGILSLSDSSGVATFNNLSFNQTGTIALSASSSPLFSAQSTNIMVSASTGTSTPTTTPVTNQNCGLHNGTLVKEQGSSTVYMVVNCVLRPFTSAAIFHARGKKFQDIGIISTDLFSHLGIGKNVGDGNDDDSTIIMSPTNSTTTPPSISGLPNGAVVKLPNDPTIYMVTNGQLQPFTSAAALNSHGKTFNDVVVISPTQFSQLTIGAPINSPSSNNSGSKGNKGHGKN